MTALLARLAIIALVATLPAAALAQDDPLVAKVNGTEIRQSDLAAAEAMIGQNLPAMMPEAKRDYLISFVTDMTILAKAAEDRKLAETPEFKRKLALTRTRLLMEALLETEGQAAVTDEAMKKVYAEATKQIGEEQEVHARHILVEKEEEAKAILADLKNGKSFDELAKEKSTDPGSKDKGGDLGYFTKDQMVPEFAEVAFKLEKGQLSDPVKTQFGWHIVKVEDKRNRPVPEFDKVKDQVEQFVVRKAQADLVTKLRSEAKIEKMTPPADAKPDTPAAPKQ